MAGDTFSRFKAAGARGRAEGENGTGPLSVAGCADIELQQKLPGGVQQAEWEAMQIQTTDGSSKVSLLTAISKIDRANFERRRVPASTRKCVYQLSLVITTVA